MAVATVYHQGWSLDEVSWEAFDPQAVEPDMLAAIKAAALVEFNAPDYVAYLKRVFRNSSADALEWIERWGAEEAQHGRALGRWAEMADPSFKLDEAFARFRQGYRPAHFDSEETALGARLPPGRNDRPLRGGERHLALITPPSATPPTSRF